MDDLFTFYNVGNPTLIKEVRATDEQHAREKLHIVNSHTWFLEADMVALKTQFDALPEED